MGATAKAKPAILTSGEGIAFVTGRKRAAVDVSRTRDSSLSADRGAVPPYAAVIPAAFGAIGFIENDSAITEIVYLPPHTPPRAPRSANAEHAVSEIERYLNDPEYVPAIRASAPGSEHQRRVWSAISAVKRGETTTYGAIAQLLRSSPRAVGQACGANPLPIVVPCHRVVGASTLGGFANARDGFLIDAKRWLLAHEGVAF